MAVRQPGEDSLALAESCMDAEHAGMLDMDIWQECSRFLDDQLAVASTSLDLRFSLLTSGNISKQKQSIRQRQQQASLAQGFGWLYQAAERLEPMYALITWSALQHGIYRRSYTLHVHRLGK